jgi:hypothetical protein
MIHRDPFAPEDRLKELAVHLNTGFAESFRSDAIQITIIVPEYEVDSLIELRQFVNHEGGAQVAAAEEDVGGLDDAHGRIEVPQIVVNVGK